MNNTNEVYLTMFNGLDIKKVLLGFILLIVLFTFIGEGIGYVTTAGDTINATGLPLAGLFASDSILPLILMGALLVAVVTYLAGKK